MENENKQTAQELINEIEEEEKHRVFKDSDNMLKLFYPKLWAKIEVDRNITKILKELR
jgi:hypothetical protein